jgi:hypothetical protein
MEGTELSQDQSQFAAILSNYAELLQATGRSSLAKEVRARGSSLFQTA